MEGSQAGKHQAHVEPMLLVQSLTMEATGETEGQQGGNIVRLCQVGVGPVLRAVSSTPPKQGRSVILCEGDGHRSRRVIGDQATRILMPPIPDACREAG